MRFVDFLKATVLACGGAGTALAGVAVLAVAADGATGLVVLLAAWWPAALALGAWLGRRAEPLPAVARLLAGARATTTLPDPGTGGPGLLLVNRLWPLLLALVAAGAVGFALPQVPVVAAGFALVWALQWRRQDRAVTAIEERDGVAFYVERTSPLTPMRLVRTPGFRRAAA